MKQSLAFILLIIAMLFATGCGQQGKTTASLEISSFSLIATDLEIMLYGQNKESGLAFSTAVDGSKTIDIPNGNWKLQVVTWEKDTVYAAKGPMTGLMRCDVLERSLSGGEVTIEFNVARTKCFHGALAQPAFLDANNEFQKIKLMPCLDVSTITGTTSTCSASSLTNFQIVAVPFLLSSESGPSFQAPSFISQCAAHNTLSDVKIPVSGEALMVYRIRAFAGGNCDGSPVKVFTFHRGLSHIPGSVKVYDNGADTWAYLGENDASDFLAHDLMPNNIYEDQITSVTLDYTSSTPADSCTATTGSTNISFYGCTCSNGVCSVSLKNAVEHWNGTASFNYNVSYSTSDGTTKTSSTGSANFSIHPVADAPIFTTIAPNINMSNVNTYEYNVDIADPDDSAFDCSRLSYDIVNPIDPQIPLSIVFSSPATGGGCIATITRQNGTAGTIYDVVLHANDPVLASTDLIHITL